MTMIRDRPRSDDGEPERRVPHGWLDLAAIAFREGTRIVTALGILAGFLWLLGLPAAERFVGTVIAGHKLAPQASVDGIETRTRGLEARQETAAAAIIRLEAQANVIEDLMTEQRADIKTLLRAIPRER